MLLARKRAEHNWHITNNPTISLCPTSLPPPPQKRKHQTPQHTSSSISNLVNPPNFGSSFSPGTGGVSRLLSSITTSCKGELVVVILFSRCSLRLDGRAKSKARDRSIVPGKICGCFAELLEWWNEWNGRREWR